MKYPLILLILCLLLTTLANVQAGTLLHLDPTAIDGNADARDDNWKVTGNIDTPDALFMPANLIPATWYAVPYAKWITNNNGGGLGEYQTFSRTFTLSDANTDLRSVEIGLDIAATSEAAIYVNGALATTFTNAAANMHFFYQAKGQAWYKVGINTLEIRVKNNARLLGFMFLEGYVSYSLLGEDHERTLRDYRKRGGRQ